MWIHEATLPKDDERSLGHCVSPEFIAGRAEEVLFEMTNANVDHRATPLPPGSEAPDFELPSTPDQSVSLTEFRGRPVIVRSGVNGTPTFYVNDARHDGSYEIETLLAALERAGSGIA